jgi:hypothetical protein
MTVTRRETGAVMTGVRILSATKCRPHDRHGPQQQPQNVVFIVRLLRLSGFPKLPAR